MTTHPQFMETSPGLGPGKSAFLKYNFTFSSFIFDLDDSILTSYLYYLNCSLLCKDYAHPWHLFEFHFISAYHVYASLLKCCFPVGMLHP